MSYNYKNFLIHQFETLESTNSHAFELANLGKISENEIILANSQTSGKGRQNRQWISPQGNLYFSLILKPKISAEKIPLISFVAISALRVAIEKICITAQDVKIQNKWPNDLLINEKKCAGLLLESKFNQNVADFIVLGIGLNVVSNPQNAIFPATNLKDCAIQIPAKEALEKFLDEFEIIYRNFLDFGFGSIRNLWLKSAFKLNEEITVKLEDKELEGIFSDLDEEGNLVLNSDGKMIKISAGDIF